MTIADGPRFARKVGYGLRPDENPADVLAWALAQLDAVPPQVGIANHKGDSAGRVVAWPPERIWSLDQRIQNLIVFRSTIEKLEKQFDTNSPDYGLRRRDLERDHRIVQYDMLRHCHQAVYSPAPVFVRFSNFWRNHFTVGDKETCNELVGHMVDAAIDANMVKSFASMLYAVTSHPAMLTYLDNIYSIGPNSPEGKQRRAGGQQADINENLARELLELHTVSPAANYTQADIIQAAEVLTGWGYIADLAKNVPAGDKWQAFFPRSQEPGEKIVMGQKVPTGKEGLRILTDFLAGHDLTIAHLSRKLAKHFIREQPTDDDIAAITAAWKAGGGSLPLIHKAVVERAASEADARKFQQPETWLYQVARVSGATPFVGFEEVGLEVMEPYERQTESLLRELGQNNWDVRQPNGFSDDEADWVSPEHMDRRTRFSELIGAGGRPLLDADALLDRVGADARLRDLVGQGRSTKDRFVLFWCSREAMEA